MSQECIPRPWLASMRPLPEPDHDLAVTHDDRCEGKDELGRVGVSASKGDRNKLVQGIGARCFGINTILNIFKVDKFGFDC